MDAAWSDVLDEWEEVQISAIEHYSYCPRQCALIHVEGTYDENVYTMRGSIAHERVHSGEDEANRGVRTLRSIPLWSERHGLRDARRGGGVPAGWSHPVFGPGED